ncbi:retrovirus-related pol polyprotein from transposon TNT 1-94 [Tanacetum coccineum]
MMKRWPERFKRSGKLKRKEKHVGGKKHSDLKNKSFDEIQVLYEKIKRSDDSFIAIDDSVKGEIKAEKGTKKRKSGHVKMIARKRPRPQPDDDSDDEHRKCLRVMALQGIYYQMGEPKNVNEVLGDESWIVAMQEELNQFVANDVWELVPQPRNMTIIGTKWVFRNKLDENGVVSRNKARLVAQGYNQQEGIDYDETYAPVARLESIRILLAYACALDFKLFQMDVKSAFLNGFINEEKQTALAISTTEAEYVSVGKACQQATAMDETSSHRLRCTTRLRSHHGDNKGASDLVSKTRCNVLIPNTSIYVTTFS